MRPRLSTRPAWRAGARGCALGAFYSIATLLSADPPTAAPSAQRETTQTIAKPAKSPRPWQLAILEKHQIPVSPESLLSELRKRIPTAEDEARLAKLIPQLGSGQFAEREAATAAIMRMGSIALGALDAATRSTDPEISLRAKLLIRSLRSETTRSTETAILRAVLREAAEQKFAGAAGETLRLLPQLEQPPLRRAAQETIWHAAQSADSAQLLAAWHNAGQVEARAAALVALARLDPAENAARAQAALTDPEFEIRLAACRALMNSRPRDCLPVLAALTDHSQESVRIESAKLLIAVLGHKVQIPSLAQTRDAWQKLIERWPVEGPYLRAADETRLWWGTTLLFVEEFELAGAVDKKYGLFTYQAPATAKARIENGRLVLDGNHEEADQRLMIAAGDLFGTVEFPGSFRIKAALGGEPGDVGAWHVGIAVGNAKTLFHPGYPGGGFRIERDDTHMPLTPMSDLGFNPTEGVVHEMTIDVSQADAKTVRLTISVKDGGPGGTTFNHTALLPREACGELSRIMLIRSGRTGGAGIFDRLTIESLP